MRCEEREGVSAVKLAAIACLVLLAAAPVARAEDTCLVKAVIGGRAVEMTHCAVAVLDDKGVTLFFSDTPIGAEERALFELNSYAKDTDPAGKERSMMHVAFCPGGGASEADAAAVSSVELSVSHAGFPLGFRQWVFELPKDPSVKFEKLTGTLTAGGRLAGRFTGGKTDELQYSWDVAFDLTLPAKGAAAGPGCGE
jgi:hypothetical protein